MQLNTLLLHLTTATAVAATSSLQLPAEFNQLLPVDRRQASSGQSYQCHADCGYTILDAKLDGHCTNATWTDMLEDCLDCANEFDLWGDYGKSVTAAAEGCGLEAVPEPAGEAASSTMSSTTGGAFTIQTSTALPTGTGAASTAAASSTASAAPSASAQPESAAGRVFVSTASCLAAVLVGLLLV